jgi:ribosome-associated toxin RatA of RatAB toxin-antitoxin module
MRTSIGILVEAPPERVFQLARDVRRWPDLLPHYRRVTIRGQRDGHVVAQMVAVRCFWRLPVPVTWRAEQWSDGSDPTDLRLRFRHVRGVTRGMDVTWHIRASREGAAVSIVHDFARRLPLLGERLLPAVIDRVFTRPIATRTLATFKRLAESEPRSTAKHMT